MLKTCLFNAFSKNKCKVLIPSLGRMRQEDHEFKFSLSYIVSLRPARATYRNPVSNNIKQTKEKLHC
jgi:hypothetical protein